MGFPLNLSFCDVLGGHAQKRGHVIIVEPVVDDSAVPVACDEPERAEPPELVAHGRLANVERGSEVARAEWPALERGQEPEPGRVAERGKERAGAVKSIGTIRQPGTGGVHGVRVDAADGAVEGIG
ncbi:MAG: hypothetical protein SangKO_099630 [Sandaracinaceae bacterium]